MWYGVWKEAQRPRNLRAEFALGFNNSRSSRDLHFWQLYITSLRRFIGHSHVIDLILLKLQWFKRHIYSGLTLRQVSSL